MSSTRRKYMVCDNIMVEKRKKMHGGLHSCAHPLSVYKYYETRRACQHTQGTSAHDHMDEIFTFMCSTEPGAHCPLHPTRSLPSAANDARQDRASMIILMVSFLGTGAARLSTATKKSIASSRTAKAIGP